MSVDTRTIENEQNLTTASAKTASIFTTLRTFCYRFTKRAFDIVFALVGCVGVIVLIPFVKISNMVTGDFAPIFYRTTRIGRGGQKVQIPQIPLYGRDERWQIGRGAS